MRLYASLLALLAEGTPQRYPNVLSQVNSHPCDFSKDSIMLS